MTILHICAVENKMSNGATVAALNHINEQAKSGKARIKVCHVKNENLPWTSQVEVVLYEDLFKVWNELDLVIFHEIYYARFFKVAKCLRERSIPYLVIPHGGLTYGAQSQRRLPKIFVNTFWAKAFIRNAIAIHFLSEREYESSRAWNKKYMISPNGVHIPSVQKEYETGKDSLELIYIGRINLFYKGLDMLCKACEQIREEMTKYKIHITIYGPREGADYDKLEEMIDIYQLHEVISVCDGVFGEKKINVMLQADAFIQPSRSEGQPMGILDAMAIGLPVIITPGTSFDKFVSTNDCGWVTVCDKNILAETILQVQEEKELLPEKSVRARECAIEHFQWENVAKKTIEKYIKYIEK